MQQPLEKLKQLISRELAGIDAAAMPNLSELVASEAGRKRAEDWIIRLASKDGMPVGAAMAQIEAELE